MFEHKSMRVAASWVIFALALVWTGAQAGAATTVGDASSVVNVVSGTLTGNIRLLSLRDAVFQDENIRTGRGSATEITFLDGTTVTMGENSELALTEVVFDPDPTVSRLIVSATRGVFRFISGTLDSTSYQIRTPVATIGIRGTVWNLIVEPDGTTTVSVDQGVVTVINRDGVAATLDSPGLSTRVRPAAATESSPPPTPPGPPPTSFTARVEKMDRTVAQGRRTRAPVGDGVAGDSIRAGAGGSARSGSGSSLVVAGDGSPPASAEDIGETVVAAGGETPGAAAASSWASGADNPESAGRPTVTGRSRTDDGAGGGSGDDDKTAVLLAAAGGGDAGGGDGSGGGSDRAPKSNAGNAAADGGSAGEISTVSGLMEYKFEILALSLVLAFLLHRELGTPARGRAYASALGRVTAFCGCWAAVWMFFGIVLAALYSFGEFALS